MPALLVHQDMPPRSQPSRPPDDPAAITVLLGDGGQAALRPLAPGETGPLDAVFDQMSARSRTSRYLIGLRELPDSFRRSLSAVDGHRHVAWLATVDGRPAGIARYIRLDDPTVAEFAFEVVDEHQRRGLAGLLFHAVTTVAAARGIRTMRASLAPTNVASRRVLTRTPVQARVVDGLIELEGPVQQLEHPRLDRGLVLRLQDQHDQRLAASAAG
jgi:GNAT superfamily N-acetyltransferase